MSRGKSKPMDPKGHIVELLVWLVNDQRKSSQIVTRQYAPAGPLACSSHATFNIHSPFIIQDRVLTSLMPLHNSRMDTLSSREHGGHLKNETLTWNGMSTDVYCRGEHGR